ncbi:MAG: ABC transporter ATP-binding protein [Candidatus Babeliaceae bacterium]
MHIPLLKIVDVTKRYNDHEALKGVSLNLYPGEVVSLLGANGAGKTTLSSLVATLRPLTSGKILFNDKSIYEDIVTYRRHIGFCPQKPNLNNYLTLRENLQFAGRYFGLPEEKITARIDEFAERFAFNKYLDKKPEVLSGGYKQRFMLTRSLMHEPKLLILDEPTVALDPHIRRQLWDYIKALKNNNICILLTTHYLDEAEVLSDRVCVLDQGKVRLVDTPGNLIQSFQKGSLEDVFIHLIEKE